MRVKIAMRLDQTIKEDREWKLRIIQKMKTDRPTEFWMRKSTEKGQTNTVFPPFVCQFIKLFICSIFSSFSHLFVCHFISNTLIFCNSKRKNIKKRTHKLVLIRVNVVILCALWMTSNWNVIRYDDSASEVWQTPAQHTIHSTESTESKQPTANYLYTLFWI